jgi:integrase
MAKLQIHDTLLIVNYLTNNNGKPYYQRRIPADLQRRFGKQKFSIRLDPANGSPAIQAQRLAKSHDALFKALRFHPELTLSEEKLAVIALLQNFGLEQGDANKKLPAWDPASEYDETPHLNEFHDFLIDISRERELTKVEHFALEALKNPLPVTLSELPEIYLDAHERGKDETFRKKTAEYWKKLMDYCGDMPVESFTREQAKGFRDHRAAQGVKTQSIQKDINIIKAIFATAMRELSLKIRNPFENVAPPGLGKDASQKPVFYPDELRAIFEESLKQDDEIRRIISLTLLSGARLGEIVGLRKEDCKLDEKLPFVEFREYGERTLKNKNAVRDVPLTPIGVDLIRKQTEAVKGNYLFPRYNDGKSKPKADNASASINKWLRDKLKIEKTSHSFRHTMKDLFRNADITEDVSQQILGHGTQTISQRYGHGLAMAKRLEALEKALGLVFDKKDKRIFGGSGA